MAWVLELWLGLQGNEEGTDTQTQVQESWNQVGEGVLLSLQLETPAQLISGGEGLYRRAPSCFPLPIFSSTHFQGHDSNLLCISEDT